MGGGGSSGSQNQSSSWSRKFDTNVLGFNELLKSAQPERLAGERAGVGFLTTLLDPNRVSDPSTDLGRAWNQQFDQQIAKAQTGPAYQAAPQARQGFARGGAVGEVHNRMMDQGSTAAQALLMNNQQMMSTLANLLPGSGKGSQASGGTTFGGGVNLCCFILLEGLNGPLPASTRITRNVVGELRPGMVRGYRKMAAWLVPAMRKWSVVKRIVNAVMVNPCVRYGEHIWENKPQRVADKQIVSFWFNVWTWLGKD